MPKLIEILPVKNELGEGVIWDAQSGSVWWTDIENSQVYRYHLQIKKLESLFGRATFNRCAPVSGLDTDAKRPPQGLFCSP